MQKITFKEADPTPSFTMGEEVVAKETGIIVMVTDAEACEAHDFCGTVIQQRNGVNLVGHHSCEWNKEVFIKSPSDTSPCGL